LMETTAESRSKSGSPPVRDMDVLASRKIPTGASEIHELAKHMAFGAVTGYLEHDRASKENRTDGREKAVDGFFQVYLYCFPEISSVTAYKAAELYVKSLLKQDEIEEYPGHSKEEILNDLRWTEVTDILLEFSRTLGLPDSYAEQTMNFFRHHGVRDPRYVIYCLESEKIFWTKVLGDDYWTKMLGSLLILLTDCHDKHDQKGLETGLEFATRYFEIVLKAMTSKRHQILAPLASELPHLVK
jgi:hypothetical protein